MFSKGCSFTDDSVMTIAVGEALLAVGPEATVKEIEEAVVMICRSLMLGIDMDRITENAELSNKLLTCIFLV